MFHIASPFPTPGQMAEAEIIADAVGGVVNVFGFDSVFGFEYG